MVSDHLLEDVDTIFDNLYQVVLVPRQLVDRQNLYFMCDQKEEEEKKNTKQHNTKVRKNKKKMSRFEHRLSTQIEHTDSY